MKQTFNTLKIISLAIILSFGLSYAIAWTAPSTTPPTGNVSAPINTGSTTASQTITGKLTVTATTTTGSLLAGGSGLFANSLTTNEILFPDGTKQSTTNNHGSRMFDSPGASTFTIPAGVTKVWVTGAGGTGGGGAADYYSVFYCAFGGTGGASYGIMAKELSVVPLQTYNIIVGAGGPGGVASVDGTNGEGSSFGTLVTLPGGSGGKKGIRNSTTGANGTIGGTYSRAGTAFLGRGGAGGGCLWSATSRYYVAYAGGPGEPGFILVEW